MDVSDIPDTCLLFIDTSFCNCVTIPDFNVVLIYCARDAKEVKNLGTTSVLNSRSNESKPISDQMTPHWVLGTSPSSDL